MGGCGVASSARRGCYVRQSLLRGAEGICWEEDGAERRDEEKPASGEDDCGDTGVPAGLLGSHRGVHGGAYESPLADETLAGRRHVVDMDVGQLHRKPHHRHSANEAGP